jgi:hypothetical protein
MQVEAALSRLIDRAEFALGDALALARAQDESFAEDIEAALRSLIEAASARFEQEARP